MPAPVLDMRVIGVLGDLGLFGLPVSAEAADLLLERRRVRRCARVGLAVGVVVIVGIAVLAAACGTSDGRGLAGYVVAMDLVLTFAILLNHEFIRRSERRLGRRLPRRHSRAEAVTIRTVLGRWVGLALGAVVALHLGLAVTLFARDDPSAAWAFVVVCVASYLLALWAVSHVVRRPVLAVDPLTLAVDDRWRSGDAHRACLPVIFAALTFSAVVGPTDDQALGLLGLVPLLLNVPFQLAGTPSLWNRRGRR